MILVTLGTQDKEFKRLLDLIEKAICNETITEEVIVQAGYTKYSSTKMKIFDLISINELDQLVKDCSILITHGGVGSILNGIKNNKRVLAVPRLKKYKEHTNDHQLQVVQELSSKKYIMAYNENDDFEEIINKIKKFKPTQWKSNTNNIINYIKEYIDK